MNDHIKVKMNPHYPKDKYSGLCGFMISRKEIKLCPEDVYRHGESKGALILADVVKPVVKPIVEEGSIDLVKEAKDIVDEGKDFLDKVTRSGRGNKKGKK